MIFQLNKLRKQMLDVGGMHRVLTMNDKKPYLFKYFRPSGLSNCYRYVIILSQLQTLCRICYFLWPEDAILPLQHWFREWLSFLATPTARLRQCSLSIIWKPNDTLTFLCDQSYTFEYYSCANCKWFVFSLRVLTSAMITSGPPANQQRQHLPFFKFTG